MKGVIGVLWVSFVVIFIYDLFNCLMRVAALDGRNFEKESSSLEKKLSTEPRNCEPEDIFEELITTDFCSKSIQEQSAQEFSLNETSNLLYDSKIVLKDNYLQEINREPNASKPAKALASIRDDSIRLDTFSRRWSMPTSSVKEEKKKKLEIAKYKPKYI